MSAPTRSWESFDEFFRYDFLSLVAFVINTGFGREEAKDAAQEAMTSAYRVWAHLTYPSAWVRRVAHRNAMRHAVRQNDGVKRAIAGGWAADADRTEVDKLAAVVERPQVERMLGMLPEQQRLVMAWHLDGFDIRETAEHLDMKPVTVRSTLRHARQRLQRDLERQSTPMNLEGGSFNGTQR